MRDRSDDEVWIRLSEEPSLEMLADVGRALNIDHGEALT